MRARFFQTFLYAIRRRRPHRILETSAVQHGPWGKEAGIHR
jgi:hypothetical protein